MDVEDRERIRSIALHLAERVKTDAAFKAQIMSAPIETLTLMGLSEENIPDFLRETGLADVTGYNIVCGLTVL